MTDVPADTAATPAAPAKAAFSAWWMLGVLFVFYFIAWVDRYSMTMMVEPIKAHLALSDFRMSIILGPAFAVFYAVFGLPLGYAADRFPRRWVIFIGMIFWSLATLASGLSNSFETLLVSRMAIGVGEAALVPAAYSLLADRFARERLATAMSVFAMGQKLGMAASFTLAAVAIAAASQLHKVWPGTAAFAPWQMAFMLLGAPGLVLAFLAFSFREPERLGARKARSSALGDRNLIAYLKSEWRLTLPLALGVAFISICSSGLSSWAPAFITRHYGWAPLQFGPVISLISFASAFAVVFKGGIMDWLYGRGMKDAHVRFYSWVLLAGVPAAAVAFSIPNPWVFVIVLGFLQVLVIPYMVYFSATIQLMAPAHLRGQMTGLYFGLSALIGAGFGPMAVGAVTDFVFRDPAKLGWSLALVVTVGLGLTWLVLRLLLRGLKPAILAREKIAENLE
ncbi:MAG: permease of the major facilitator superfamily [Caulobacter sp.]|nr:permease of the major facilitator superfamily [Caulobacter sp.]